MQLKRYQTQALKALRQFLEACRESLDIKASFDAVTRSLQLGRYQSTYRPLKDMDQVPYVCIRIPTGGGKTILGSHAVKIAGESYLERDFPLALWLVPSNTIRTQTAEALKNPSHPYRQALDDAFEGRVRVFDIADFAQIRPVDLSDNACIIVGTIQTLRVTNTEGRKVYSHHEDLEPHFTRLSRLPDTLEKNDKGQTKFSFANLLHLHHPLVIVDEAHNAVTGLTQEMQQRINPACIIEFTATPKPRSNVLFSVSAGVLKDEEMIKLPIVLTAHNTWQAAISGALSERARLSEVAGQEPQYIRPLILFQGQNKDQEITVEVLKKHLIEEEKIQAEKIAVATGNQRELDGIDLFSPDCPIEYIITVQALKEGWDCSFAYVFCTVANIRSKTDIEQLLGRVLRMPYARKRTHEALNHAYTHVCEPEFIDAAVQLRDRLVDMGFEEEEAEDNIQVSDLGLEGGSAESPAPEPVTFTLEGTFETSDLPETVQTHIHVETTKEGQTRIKIDAPLSEDDETSLLNALKPSLPKEQTKELIQKLTFQRQMQERLSSPASKGIPFTVPQVYISRQGELALAEKGLFLELGNWKLLDYPATLSEHEFDPTSQSQAFKLDVKSNKVTYEVLNEAQRVKPLLGLDTPWDERVLARWLDRHCRIKDVPQPALLEFVRRVVADQLHHKGVELGVLVQAKYRLAKALVDKIDQYREQARKKGYQSSLFASDASPEVSFEYAFAFPKDQYPAAFFYRGSYQFKKHYYGNHRIGEMKNKGEEFECARAIDMNPNVKFWVRNLESRPKTSFRLPLADGWFYPDFVALLDDGRIFVIEYKGEHLETNEDTQEKANIGELWEEKSGGKGLFLMAVREKDGKKLDKQIADKLKING